MSSFDFIKYDEKSEGTQTYFKAIFVTIEEEIANKIPHSWARDNMMKSLNEAYMWLGKAIRDEQLTRIGSADLNEQRGDG